MLNEIYDYVSKSLSSDLKIVSPLSKSKLDYQNIIHTIPNDELLFNKITSFIKRDTVPSQKFIISDSYNKIVVDKHQHQHNQNQKHQHQHQQLPKQGTLGSQT